MPRAAKNPTDSANVVCRECTAGNHDKWSTNVHLFHRMTDRRTNARGTRKKSGIYFARNDIFNGVILCHFFFLTDFSLHGPKILWNIFMKFRFLGKCSMQVWKIEIIIGTYRYVQVRETSLQVQITFIIFTEIQFIEN